MVNRYLEKIYTRRSVRDFLPKKVSASDLKKIAEAGLRSPSSKNSCPWHIVLLTGENKDKVTEWIDEALGVYEQNLNYEKTGGKATDTTNASNGIIKKASGLFLIFNKSPYIGGMNKLAKECDAKKLFTYSVEIIGIGACMENMLLAAHSMGLAGVALADVYPAAETIRKNLKLDYDFIIGLAVGYGAYKPPKRDINWNDFQAM